MLSCRFSRALLATALAMIIPPIAAAQQLTAPANPVSQAIRESNVDVIMSVGPVGSPIMGGMANLINATNNRP